MNVENRRQGAIKQHSSRQSVSDHHRRRAYDAHVSSVNMKALGAVSAVALKE